MARVLKKSDISAQYSDKEAVDSYFMYKYEWPQELAEKIIEYLKGQQKSSVDTSDGLFDFMYDVGCGSGQATKLFSQYFHSIVGTDIAEEQIEKARTVCNSKNITFKTEPGDEMSVNDSSVDLVTSACAVHYFDLNKFITECRRVLKPNGCVAIFYYTFSDIHLDPRFQGGGSTVSGMDLFRSIFLQPRFQFAEDINHPVAYSFGNFHQIYDRVTTMKKELLKDVLFDWVINLGNLKSYLDNLPFNKTWMQTLGDSNPLDVAAEKMKDLWGVQDIDDKDVNLQITLAAKIIMLKK